MLDKFFERIDFIESEQIFSRITEMGKRHSRLNVSAAVLAALAGLVAFAGLMSNNVVLIIGAMILSPLLGPINATTISIALGKPRQAAQAQFVTVALLGLVVVFTSIVAALSIRPTFSLTPEILLRGRPSLQDVGVAVLLGIASAWAIVARFPESLAGVAIAASLVPPAAVVGIGIAAWDLKVSLGSLLLTITNVIGLELGSILTLLAKGVHPRRFYQREARSAAFKYSIYLILGLTTLIILLTGLIAKFY